eukprot:269648_1
MVDCINQWNLYYNNGDKYDGNVSELLVNYTFSFIHDTICEDCYSLFDRNVEIISITFAVICATFLVIILMFLLKKLYTKIKIKYAVYTNKIYTTKYISKKPELYVLVYAILVNYLMFVVVIWWTTKTIMFHNNVKNYCSFRYDSLCPNLCNADMFCRYEEQCQPIMGIKALFITWCVAFSIVTFLWFIACCCPAFRDDRTWSVWYFTWSVWTDLKNNKEYFNKVYGKRDFWDLCDKCVYDKKGQLQYAWNIDYELDLYPIYILLTWIIVELYRDFPTDYAIKWYEFYQILIICILKIILIFCYKYGPKYDPTHDAPHQIVAILTDSFGYQIGDIIKTYLPLFYEKSMCSSDVILTKEEAAKFKNLYYGRETETVELMARKGETH